LEPRYKTTNPDEFLQQLGKCSEQVPVIREKLNKIPEDSAGSGGHQVGDEVSAVPLCAEPKFKKKSL
jgi:hypothetical protein